MNENLKVNSKTDILEFKRKHNLLVENGSIKANVSNIKSLSNDVINNLRCGDVVLKEDSSGKHAYLVSFKSDSGLCLTYCDAYCVETQSYDKSGDNWVYNSEDKTIIAEPLMENIVDSQGHKRFVEGDIDLRESVSQITKLYGKWSLSGSHLLIVLAFSVADTTVVSSQAIATVNVPEWVLNKIVPLFGNNVDFKILKAFGSDNSAQDVSCFMDIDDGLRLYLYGFTATADRTCRIAFDLLIDNA